MSLDRERLIFLGLKGLSVQQLLLVTAPGTKRNREST